MRLYAHLDPHVLESDLLDRIAAAKRADPLAPVLVIVPSRRLADHVARRIGESLGAAIDLEILFHRALVTRVLADSGTPPPAPAGRLLLEAALDDVLRGLGPAHALASFVRSRSGASSSLLDTLVELRESGVAPGDVAAAAQTARERDLAAVYRAYASRLEALRERGLADDAARAAAAVPHAAAFARRFSRILHHGAYELVGANLDLVRALDGGLEVEFLLPAAPGRAVSSYAEDFARRFLLPPSGAVAPIEAAYGCCLGDRLATLYDEEARPEPLPEDRWSLVSVQGASAEFDWALRSAASGLGAGPAAHERALIARTWTPYGAAISETLDAGALACDVAPGLPLRREPFVAEAVAVLRVVADDFPRAATAELLRSPRIDWGRLAPGASPFPGSFAEGWSREAGIVRGRDAWTEDLPAWAAAPRLRDDDETLARDREAALRIAAAVEALARLVDAGTARGWCAHADVARALVVRLYADARRREEAERAVAPLLDAARDRERVLGDAAPVPFAAFVAWIERAADTLAAPGPERAGAIPVVDAMQARGATFERVHLVGLQSGLLPRIPREDPFCDDAFRARLRERTGRPVSIKLDADREERLLLALALGAARRELHVSWARADEDGKAKASSPALREIARVLLGFPDAEALRDEAFAVPSHPRARLEAIAARTGLLAPLEEAALVALEAEGREDGRAALVRRMPELAPRLDLVSATESFAPDDLRFDARVAPAPARAWSVSSLERLGRCALQFFFHDVLRVRAMVEEPSAFSASAREIGERIHALLESVYATLMAEGAFGAAEPARLVARGVDLVEARWEDEVGSASRRIARAVPGLHGIETELWKGALRRFVEEDLTALARDGAAPADLERSVEGTVDAGRGVRAVVRGRFDRIVRSGDLAVVGDYKTSGDLRDRLDPGRIVKGETLQVPLYRELANGAPVVLLGVGPSYDPSPEAEEARRARFDGFGHPRLGARQDEGFRETLRVLLRLPARGVYPIRPGRHCGFCDWRAACRHAHPPTVERRDNAPDGADYRALEKKTKTKPLLAEIDEETESGAGT